jgi:hypothetical protein
VGAALNRQHPSGGSAGQAGNMERAEEGMPLDGTELGLFENHPLAKLGAVERLLVSEQQWCKGKLRDGDGRHCLVGAIQAVQARQTLEPIILRAAREVGGKCYWRIEFFNDDPRTTHADVLRVLRRARENIIAGMIEGGRRPWHHRWAQALRALCSGSASEICASIRFGAGNPGPVTARPAAPFREVHADEHAVPVHEACEVL